MKYVDTDSPETVQRIYLISKMFKLLESWDGTKLTQRDRHTIDGIRKLFKIPKDTDVGGWLIDHQDLVDGVTGPHGYAVYKAWLARQGVR